MIFKITTYGESHGKAVGVVIDGCPPGLKISEEEIQLELDRRRPGQSSIVTQRKESDAVTILSGIHEGITLGTPISLLVWNSDQRSKDYDEIKDKYRPSHADFTYEAKYGVRAWEGGGRASARETIGRVAAGAIAKKWLSKLGIDVVGYVMKVKNIGSHIDVDAVSSVEVEKNIIRCPDPQAAKQMIELIEATRKEGNSVGGIIGCTVRGVPAGWGEPIFDRLEADLAKAMLSIPATKGFEIGSGFAGTEMTGREHNDEFIPGEDGKVLTSTNYSGGVQGGISNGMPIHFRVAFKPTATIMHAQNTVDRNHEATTIKGRGRHDPCVLPRAVPIVEAMTYLVLIDHALRHHALTN